VFTDFHYCSQFHTAILGKKSASLYSFNVKEGMAKLNGELDNASGWPDSVLGKFMEHKRAHLDHLEVITFFKKY
jgi:hypothetical protein